MQGEGRETRVPGLPGSTQGQVSWRPRTLVHGAPVPWGRRPWWSCILCLLFALRSQGDVQQETVLTQLRSAIRLRGSLAPGRSESPGGGKSFADLSQLSLEMPMACIPCAATLPRRGSPLNPTWALKAQAPWLNCSGLPGCSGALTVVQPNRKHSVLASWKGGNTFHMPSLCFAYACTP